MRESLDRLGLERTDLHLIHWPNPSQGKYVEAWRALVQLQKDGLVRSIGVSNFTEEHLARIIDDTGVTPAVNQVELHPRFQQGALRAFHAEAGIVTDHIGTDPGREVGLYAIDLTNGERSFTPGTPGPALL